MIFANLKIYFRTKGLKNHYCSFFYWQKWQFIQIMTTKKCSKIDFFSKVFQNIQNASKCISKTAKNATFKFPIHRQNSHALHTEVCQTKISEVELRNENFSFSIFSWKRHFALSQLTFSLSQRRKREKWPARREKLRKKLKKNFFCSNFLLFYWIEFLVRENTNFQWDSEYSAKLFWGASVVFDFLYLWRHNSKISLHKE